MPVVIFDFLMLIASSFLYVANVLFFRKVGCVFFVSYFNDVCCGIWFMAYSNLLLSRINIRLCKLHIVALYLFIWSLVWEYLGPYIKNSSICDYYDILAYLSGGIMYYIATKVFSYIRNL